MSTILLNRAASLDDYLAAGGGAGLSRARGLGPAAVVAEIRNSGLRGRGGAGFPTGIKWAGAASADGPAYVVCNAAEGEPGTFKDRWLIRTNPYQLIEGMAVAALAIGAAEAFIGIKARFEPETAALHRAVAEMAVGGMLDGLEVTIVPGPDDYLFGVETALLEVIEGRDPLPRIHPPYVQGLFEETIDDPVAVVVNNVETLSNVPHIVARGAGWFRSFGTEDSPGTMVFTIGGDVEQEVVAELPLGTPFSRLLSLAGGVTEGRSVTMVANGVSNRPLRGDELETRLDYASMQDIGSGLGSGGFTVYDETACVAGVTRALSAFLANGSCGQCPPCKRGTTEITRRLGQLAGGVDGVSELEDIAAWTVRVTDSNRCGLGAGEAALIQGVLAHFGEHLARHVAGVECPGERTYTAPVIYDWDSEAGRFTYGVPPPL